MNPTEATGTSPSLVLDTNAVLDWLVFRDASMNALSAAIEQRRVRWIGCLRMREELLRTLSYSTLERWKPDSKHTLGIFDRWVDHFPDPVPTRAGPLLSSDADDQVFIDLALSHSARWLVTKDRALLKLARPALCHGARVLRPGDWAFE
jgi:predicted nucleic acid-binding protein